MSPLLAKANIYFNRRYRNGIYKSTLRASGGPPLLEPIVGG